MRVALGQHSSVGAASTAHLLWAPGRQQCVGGAQGRRKLRPPIEREATTLAMFSAVGVKGCCHPRGAVGGPSRP